MNALLMIMDAHVHNFMKPGTYNKRIQETLKLNEIKGIKLPETPDSSLLMKALGNNEKVRQDIEREKKRLRSEEEQRPAEEEVGETEDEILERHLRVEEEVVRNATTIGMEIITAESECVRGMEPGAFKILVREGKVKYKLLERCRYEEREIEEMIHREQIEVPINNAVKVSNNIFQKIRNGSKYVGGKRSKVERAQQ